jgi:phosphoglycolate phosphatase
LAKYFQPGDIEKAVEKFREYYDKAGVYENVPYSGVTQMLAACMTSGKEIAVATSKPTPSANVVLKHFKLDRYFSFIIGSNLDGTRSRKGEVIRYALDQIDPDRKKRTVMIGDREHDIIGARENGIQSIGVTYSCYGSYDELTQAGAGCVAESMEALERLLLCGTT